MSFRHHACAYLIGFQDPQGRFTDAGIYSDYPVEQTKSGSQKLLLSMGSNDYPTAKLLLDRELVHRTDLHWVFEMRTMKTQKARGV